MATGSLNASARSKTAAVSPWPPLFSPASLLSSSGAPSRSPLRLWPLPRRRPRVSDGDAGFLLLLFLLLFFLLLSLLLSSSSGGSLHSKQWR